MLKLKEPEGLMSQLRILSLWGGADTSLSGITKEGVGIEPELHDLCHCVTSNIRLPPPPGWHLSDYVGKKLTYKTRETRRRAMEVVTIAAELHLLEALGVLQDKELLLSRLASSLNFRTLPMRVKERCADPDSLEDARKVVRLIRYHAPRISSRRQLRNA